MKKFVVLIALLAVGFAYSRNLPADETVLTNDGQTIDEKIASKSYVFEAQIAIPTGGRTIQLNSYFDVRVSGDTLVCSLPYYGRAYTAPINPAEGGYNFTTTKYQYIVNKPKEDEWKIELVPLARTQGEKFMLTAFSNGTASLLVTSNNRQPINFRGVIK